jgi:hypothetical protein
MHTHDRVITGFRRRLGRLFFARNALGALAAWTFLWGTGVFALRAVGTPRTWLLWGLAGVPVALAIAVFLAVRRLPSRAAVRAVLDRHGSCGGLLMAGGERELGAWDRALPEPAMPPVRWRSGRAWGLLVGGLTFLATGFLVPEGLADLGRGPALEVGKEVDRLSKQIDVLKEEEVIEEARAADLQKKLEQVEEEARGRDPAKTLEALDHVEDMVRQKAREAAESATKQTEKLAEMEALTEVLRRKDEAGLAPQVSAEAMSDLAAMTREALEENKLLSEAMDEALQEALKGGALSPEQLKALAEALRGAKGGVYGRMAKLHKVKLIDAEALANCKKCGECNGEELIAYLSKCKGTSAADLKSLCKYGGRGGITRGPGHAVLDFLNNTREGQEAFKEEALPESTLEALKKSMIAGVGRQAPEVNKTDPGSRTGALTGARAGGGSANKQVILPRHRRAVERYFDRKK